MRIGISMAKATLSQLLLKLAVYIGIDPDDDEDTRLQKEILILTTIIISAAGVLWGLMYLYFNEPVAASIPVVYSIISTINLFIFKTYRHYREFRFTQLLLILLLPFLLTIALGGYINSSAVILWSLLAPLGALMCCKGSQAAYWSIAYLTVVVASGLLHPHVRTENNLPSALIIFFFVVNIGAVSTIALAVLNHFVRQKDLSIELMRKHRELEKAYMQQEVMLRQNEKLATLGKMCAGIAHELNNPAAAVQRNIKLLQDTVGKLEQAEYRLGQMQLSTAHTETLELHKQIILDRVDQPVSLDPLTRSNREDDMEEWLELKGVKDAGSFAPMLVDLGYTGKELSELADRFTDEMFPVVAGFLCNYYSAHSLLEETAKGITRIIEIVKALQSYSYLDQAPVQSIDIHAGLNDTLVMLQNRLKNGITVRRDYAVDLPHIDAFGSELNQVWTHIIDNAIDALNDQGEIIIKTYGEDSSVVVEIMDNGPGIPEDIVSEVFDPFVTTKSPGEGTGLGLNISHNIIVQKHKGTISVESKPGETRFRIRLPVKMEDLK
jgi:signal transduction histidine kinase